MEKGLTKEWKEDAKNDFFKKSGKLLKKLPKNYFRLYSSYSMTCVSWKELQSSKSITSHMKKPRLSEWI